MARVRLDRAGVRAMLKAASTGDAVGDLAQAVASAVRADPAVARHSAEVVVDRYETDRAAASVTIRHPGGRGIEAKHGSLTRAAASVGLDVKDNP